MDVVNDYRRIGGSDIGCARRGSWASGSLRLGHGLSGGEIVLDILRVRVEQLGCPGDFG